MRMGQALKKILGRDTGPPREESMKVKLTQTGLFGELGQIRLFGMVFVEIANHASNAVVIVHARILSLEGDVPTRFLRPRNKR